MSQCNKCKNRGFVIFDTNFLVFIIDFIFHRNNKTDVNFLVEFDQFLSWITHCSVNTKLNATEILYKNEINPFNRLPNGRSVSLIHNSDFFFKYKKHRSINYRREVKKRIDKNLIRHKVNGNDIIKLRTIVNPWGKKKGPSSEDLSLILLALRESNNTCYPCIIVTEDTDLRTSIEKKIHKQPNFVSSNGSTLNTKNLISMGFLNYLLSIYNDCKFDYIDELAKFYDINQAKFIKKLSDSDTLKGKLRLSNSSAADIASIMRIKLERRLRLHA